MSLLMSFDRASSSSSCLPASVKEEGENRHDDGDVSGSSSNPTYTAATPFDVNSTDVVGDGDSMRAETGAKPAAAISSNDASVRYDLDGSRIQGVRSSSDSNKGGWKVPFPPATANPAVPLLVQRTEHSSFTRHASAQISPAFVCSTIPPSLPPRLSSSSLAMPIRITSLERSDLPPGDSAPDVSRNQSTTSAEPAASCSLDGFELGFDIFGEEIDTEVVSSKFGIDNGNGSRDGGNGNRYEGSDQKSSINNGGSRSKSSSIKEQKKFEGTSKKEKKKRGEREYDNDEDINKKKKKTNNNDDDDDDDDDNTNRSSSSSDNSSTYDSSSYDNNNDNNNRSSSNDNNSRSNVDTHDKRDSFGPTWSRFTFSRDAAIGGGYKTVNLIPDILFSNCPPLDSSDDGVIRCGGNSSKSRSPVRDLRSSASGGCSTTSISGASAVVNSVHRPNNGSSGVDGDASSFVHGRRSNLGGGGVAHLKYVGPGGARPFVNGAVSREMDFLGGISLSRGQFTDGGGDRTPSGFIPSANAQARTGLPAYSSSVVGDLGAGHKYHPSDDGEDNRSRSNGNENRKRNDKLKVTSASSSSSSSDSRTSTSEGKDTTDGDVRTAKTMKQECKSIHLQGDAGGNDKRDFDLGRTESMFQRPGFRGFRANCNVCVSRKTMCSFPDGVGMPCGWCKTQDLQCLFAEKRSPGPLTTAAKNEVKSATPATVVAATAWLAANVSSKPSKMPLPRRKKSAQAAPSRKEHLSVVGGKRKKMNSAAPDAIPLAAGPHHEGGKRHRKSVTQKTANGGDGVRACAGADAAAASAISAGASVRGGRDGRAGFGFVGFAANPTATHAAVQRRKGHEQILATSISAPPPAGVANATPPTKRTGGRKQAFSAGPSETAPPPASRLRMSPGTMPAAFTTPECPPFTPPRYDDRQDHNAAATFSSEMLMGLHPMKKMKTNLGEPCTVSSELEEASTRWLDDLVQPGGSGPLTPSPYAGIPGGSSRKRKSAQDFITSMSGTSGGAVMGDGVDRANENNSHFADRQPGILRNEQMVQSRITQGRTEITQDVPTPTMEMQALDKEVNVDGNDAAEVQEWCQELEELQTLLFLPLEDTRSSSVSHQGQEQALPSD